MWEVKVPSTEEVVFANVTLDTEEGWTTKIRTTNWDGPNCMRMRMRIMAASQGASPPGSPHSTLTDAELAELDSDDVVIAYDNVPVLTLALHHYAVSEDQIRAVLQDEIDTHAAAGVTMCAFRITKKTKTHLQTPICYPVLALIVELPKVADEPRCESLTYGGFLSPARVIEYAQSIHKELEKRRTETLQREKAAKKTKPCALSEESVAKRTRQQTKSHSD